MKRTCPTDPSDAEWGCMEPCAPPPSRRGRPRTHAARQILDAVFRVSESGCPWRSLPRGFPPRETVHRWFGRRRTDGTFQRLNAELRERVRARLGRNQHPSAGVADSRSAETAGVGGGQGGHDGNEKVRGGKRHLLVDTEGSVLEAKARGAKVPDQDGPKLPPESARTGLLGRLEHPWPDAGHQGRGERWAEEEPGMSVRVVREPPRPAPEKVVIARAREWHGEGEGVGWRRLMPPRGHAALPRGWVAERTFSWLGQNGRMSKDYERPCASAEAFVCVAMIRLMVRRLARG